MDLPKCPSFLESPPSPQLSATAPPQEPQPIPPLTESKVLEVSLAGAEVEEVVEEVLETENIEKSEGLTLQDMIGGGVGEISQFEEIEESEGEGDEISKEEREHEALMVECKTNYEVSVCVTVIILSP
jgi:hypothetical protein